jgi:hypothetical protein
MCPDKTTMVFQISQGLSNPGYLISTPTTFIEITSLTKDSLYNIDKVTGVRATPTLIAAIISVQSLTLSNTQAAITEIKIDIAVKFGARI